MKIKKLRHLVLIKLRLLPRAGYGTCRYFSVYLRGPHVALKIIITEPSDDVSANNRVLQ